MRPLRRSDIELNRMDARAVMAVGAVLLLVWSGTAAGAGTDAPRPFGSGETLSFDVYYGPLKAGTATMEVGAREDLRGRECLRLSSSARSGVVLSAFFKVEDRVESWLDVEHLRPLRFEKHLREGHYVCDQAVDYYHEHRIARSSERTLEIHDDTRDALSSLYWIRTQELEPGDTLWMSSTSARNSYDLRVDVTGRETVKTPAGEFDCVIVRPHLAKDGGIFDHKGQMWVWLTDDALHLPVKMVSKVAIGSIQAVLVDHELGSFALGPEAHNARPDMQE